MKVFCKSTFLRLSKERKNWLPRHHQTLLAMKLTVILSTAILLHVHAGVFSQNVTLSGSDMSLKKVFSEIKKQTGYTFFYTIAQLKNARPVTLKVARSPLPDLLQLCFADEPLSYYIQGTTVFITEKKTPPASAPVNPESAPKREIHGKVTASTGEPLSGVTVEVENVGAKTATDSKGEYTISVPDDAHVLIFTSIGYIARRVNIDDHSEINVVLQRFSKELGDMVVIGYGVVKKSDLTGAVSSVSGDKITQVKGISNVAQALQGQAAGVQVNQASGQPGEAMVIKIRGTNSINASNLPLYVVDGMPVDYVTADLNPDDIERVEVLKDASSIAIYGSRGANGVIMITTKKGREGKTNVSYSGYYGVQTLRKKLKLINASEYAELQNEAVTNDNASGVNSPALPVPWTQNQIDSLKGKGTDWQSLVYRPANVQDHDLSVSGGNANTKYFTSFGYFDQDGIIKNSNFTRLSFRGNLSQQITDKLSFTTNLSLQNSKYVQANYTGADGNGGIPFQTEVMPPTQGVYDASGNYTVFTGVSYGATNPVGMERLLYNPSNTLRIIGNTGIVYEILGGLRLKLNAGMDDSYNQSDYYAPSTLSIGQPGGKASKSYTDAFTFVTEDLVTYDKTINRHNIAAVAGITYQDSKSQDLNSGTATGFISDIYQDNNIQSANTLAQPSTNYSDSKLVSYLGRVNYNYSERYFATVTGRYDGSSVFGENNKFAFFPSGALAWRISQENFMKSVKPVSNLKLRTSYGLSGNQAINPYQTLPSLSNVNLNFNNQTNVGYVQGSLPNNSLKWENTAEFDLGADLGLFQERIQFSADYYDKKTTHLLLNVPLPTSTGFGSVTQNAGTVQNKGYEFQLTTVNLTGAFKWNSVLSFSHNRNKLLSLGNNAFGKPITYQEIGTAGANWFPDSVGFGMNELYGYKIIGIYQTDQQAIANGEPTKHAGDYEEENMHPGTGHVIDGTDRVILTHLQPKFTFGFNNNFSWKNFDLSLMFVGSYGNDIVNEFRKYNLAMTGQWTPTQAAYDQRWQGAGTSNTVDKPSVNSAQTLLNYANSKWVENGSYIKLRDITLGYNFSPSLLRRARISSVRVYISAQNYLTITKYSGYDPEAAWSDATVNGWDRGVYPSSKSITGGLKFNF
jgi:TonB-linked SusC/RagA family outer membrane protein